MGEILLRNTTQQVQELLVRETTNRRFHTIQVQALGQVDLDEFQVTPDIRRKCIKGIFKAFDSNGKKLSFEQVADKVEAPAPVNATHAEVTPEGDTEQDAPVPEGDAKQNAQVPDAESTESFDCDVCGESFASNRALSSHKRSHK